MLVCNSAESMQQAFIDHHATFERQSPQMRQRWSLCGAMGCSSGAGWSGRKAAA
jgi:hypothetical protein